MKENVADVTDDIMAKDYEVKKGVIGELQNKRQSGSTRLPRGRQVEKNLLQCVEVLTDHVRRGQ